MALTPSPDDPRAASRRLDAEAPDSSLEHAASALEQHFMLVHAALLDLRKGDREAQFVIRKEMSKLGDSDAAIAAERVQDIIQNLPPATNLAEARFALLVARDIGPYLPDRGLRLFERAAQDGLSASCHSVARSAYLEIADKAFDVHDWEMVTTRAMKAITLRPTLEEGERIFTVYCAAHALLGVSYSAQARMDEAIYCANAIRQLFDKREPYFEKLLRFGLPNEAADMDAVVNALRAAGRIYREEGKPGPFEGAFERALRYLDGDAPLQVGLRVNVLVHYASERRELSDILDGSVELTSEEVLDAALQNLDEALELISSQGENWYDYRLHGDAFYVKADILVERDQFEAALSEAEKALAQYHQSEALGICCEAQINAVAEIIELCNDKLAHAAEGGTNDPSVDDDDDEDQSGPGFLPYTQWTP